MLQPYHYVPVLRWKRAEEDALESLGHIEELNLLPLLQLVNYDVVPKIQDVSPSARADKFAELVDNKILNLKDIWGTRPLLIDNKYLSSMRRLLDEKYMLNTVLELGRRYGVRFTPITGFDRTQEYQESIVTNIILDSRGIGLRISINEIIAPSFRDSLINFIVTLNLAPEKVDLIIDYGRIDHSVDVIEMHKVLIAIPNLLDWRSLVIIGGSFPYNLIDFPIGRNTVQRHDWIFWRDSTSDAAALGRIPTYGDYTIQSPIYKKPPDYPNISASIRYTAEDYWVVMRGEGHTKSNRGNGKYSAQYCANALLLSEASEFAREDFSASDKYIFEKREDYDHPGNATTWLYAGINHHITYALHQITDHLRVPLEGSATVEVSYK